MDIQISTYQDYLNITGKKTCPCCGSEYPQDTHFYAPFTFGEEMCDFCITETYQELGEL